MKLPSLIENVIIALVNGALCFAMFLIVAILLRLPIDAIKVLSSIAFGLGFIVGFAVLALMQSIPDEPD